MPAIRVFLSIVLGLVLAACASLPEHVERVPSIAVANTDDTRLGRALHEETAAHPGRSGIHELPVAQEAFAARILLAQAADRTLDIQYYLWHADTTGWLLWEAIWQAAERGVRVRLLLDDANTGRIDPIIAALDEHPNIEVRLFNPFANRRFRIGDLAFDFTRVNRRMHNKSFTADNQVSIVGGRNVGDEYFGAHADIGFQDLDVMAVGPVVREVSSQFDLFWNSESAYPAESVILDAPEDGPALLRQGWEKVHQSPEATSYMDAVRRTALVRQTMDRSLAYEWTRAHVVNDDPAKVRDITEREDLLMRSHLEQAMGKPARELDLVSPYFVPGRRGTKALEALAKSGVKIRVLTNSLSATDVGAVHAGYSRYRKELLDDGVAIFELKPGSALPPVRNRDEDRQRGSIAGSAGSSAASLHAKTFAVDRDRLFVGSFNLDQRSIHLNTEMGIVIDSPALASRLATQLDTRLPDIAYQVRLGPDGQTLEWIDRTPEGETHYATEPGASPMRRLWVDFLSMLPIEWLL